MFAEHQEPCNVTEPTVLFVCTEAVCIVSFVHCQESDVNMKPGVLADQCFHIF
jgi:hypothetical protein